MDQQVRPGAPFRNAILMHTVIAGLMQKFSGTSLMQMLQALGPYESRGKGRGTYPGKKPGNRTGKLYAPNGARECERRRRQIAKGMLKCTA